MAPQQGWLAGLSVDALLGYLAWAEAEGEGVIGQVAVIAVVQNRVKARRWANTIHGVVLQPYQFSGLARLSRQMNLPAHFRLLGQLGGLGLLADPTGGATHFCRYDINVFWRDELLFLCRIGDHVFYREG